MRPTRKKKLIPPSLASLFLVVLSSLQPTIALIGFSTATQPVDNSFPTATTTMTATKSSGEESTSNDSPVQRVVIAGAGVIGVSTAYYLAKDFGIATTLIDPTGTIAPAASGKAGGFLALDWNDHSPVGPLTRRSFALHQEIADSLGAEKIQYRRLECVAIPVGDNNLRRRPSGRKLEGIEWAEGENAMGDASLLGDRSTIAQVHPKKLCEAMWECVRELTPESELVLGRVVSEVHGGEESSAFTVGAKLEDGSVVKGDALLYSCGPWTANNMYGTKYHSLVVPTTKTLNQCVFFSGVGDPEVYVRDDDTAYCTGFPDPPIQVTEFPGEEKVRQDVIDKIRTSVETASSYSDGETVNYLVFSDDNDKGEAKALKQACYLPSTIDGIPMMGKVPGKDRSKTYVSAGHTCWGILMGPASGEAMAHEIVTGKSPHVNLRLFAPERFGGSLEMVPPPSKQ
mmetsp:Transcript_3321/g.7887  ORF Transcript_3321/g.7887 Transcript_3321/m.7887 type:complete len:456 (-) Transcript_3321:1951-3318(-)